MPALGGPAAWPVADVSQLCTTIQRLMQLSEGDNLPTTVAIRSHVIRRAIELKSARLLPVNWTPDGYVRKETSLLNLDWLREDAWELGRAALLPEVDQRMRTYIDWDGSSAIATVVGDTAPVKAGVLPEGDYSYTGTLVDELGSEGWL